MTEQTVNVKLNWFLTPLILWMMLLAQWGIYQELSQLNTILVAEFELKEVIK